MTPDQARAIYQANVPAGDLAAWQAVIDAITKEVTKKVDSEWGLRLAGND